MKKLIFFLFSIAICQLASAQIISFTSSGMVDSLNQATRSKIVISANAQEIKVGKRTEKVIATFTLGNQYMYRIRNDYQFVFTLDKNRVVTQVTETISYPDGLYAVNKYFK